MSHWVYLENEDGKLVEVTRFEEGGTYALGGQTEAELNITYNYSPHYYRVLDKKKGLEWLHGKKAKGCIHRLEDAVAKLGTVRDQDYWKATEGNAGYALSILLGWAKANPEATFRVS